VAQVCRRCRSEIVDDLANCACCGLQQLTVPTPPAKRQSIWNLAWLGVAVLGVASASLAVGVVRYRSVRSHLNPQRLSVPSQPRIVYQRSLLVEKETRKVYPYSIVPGGAKTVDEAKLSMRRADVRANYANLDFAKLHEVKLATSLFGYVSYRFGDKIYWTAKKLTLRAGETVFTDGVHMVRGRCLNCYSAIPMLPIRPNEPTANVLDTPVDVPLFTYKFPVLPVEVPTLPPPLEELTPGVPILPATALVPIKKGGGIWFPLIPFIPPIHHHPGSPPSTSTPPPKSPIVPPVVVVPEPNYAWLVAAGFLALILTHGLRRRVILKSPK
jgi:hypothetical protein